MSRSWFLVECSALLILLLVNLSSSSVLASTFYLSPSGSDSNNGQSVSTPWMTFNKAFTTMKGGDELVLLDGTYSVATGTGIINWQGSNSAQPPSGTSLNAPTLIRAQNPGKVKVDGALFIGRSFRKDSYISVNGITFEGDSQIYNCDYCTVKNCGFHGSFWIGTNDHQMDNQYNLVEDCWMWGSQRRIISGNYRANYNVWRRVVVRGDGCGQTYCQGSGNPNVGFTVYDSHDTTVENMIIVDRILATGDYPGADFAAAQHTNDIKWYNGRNRWLGCITVNCPDVGFYLEPDYTLDPTFYLKNCVAVNTKETGLNIARKASNITYENVMAIRCEGDGIRVSPEPGVVSGVVRNAVSYGSGRYGINSQFKPSYVNVYGSGVSPFQQTTPTVGVSLSDPTTSSPVALKYPVRIEKNSFLSKTGYNNEDIGANIVVKYGLDGTRFGDSNVELLTANSLWPWPNEDRIKAEMCASTTRGFCSSGKRLDGVNAVTLTSYIWEILGNPIPTEIYQNSNTSTTCFGIDSTSAQVCSGHGVCVSLDSCSCTGGYTGSNCATPPAITCFGIAQGNASVCSGHGTCVANNQCSCTGGYTGSNCATPPAITCFGIAQGNASVCSGHGNCVANNQCSCTGGYTGSNCATPPSNAISCYGIAQGNSSVCSGHGTCTAQDQCNCNSGYSGTKCENVNQPKPSPIVSKSIRNFNSTTRNDSSALFEGNKVVTWGWMILVVFMFVEGWM